LWKGGKKGKSREGGRGIKAGENEIIALKHFNLFQGGMEGGETDLKGGGNRRFQGGNKDPTMRSCCKARWRRCWVGGSYRKRTRNQKPGNAMPKAKRKTVTEAGNQKKSERKDAVEKKRRGPPSGPRYKRTNPQKGEKRGRG